MGRILLGFLWLHHPRPGKKTGAAAGCCCCCCCCCASFVRPPLVLVGRRQRLAPRAVPPFGSSPAWRPLPSPYVSIPFLRRRLGGRSPLHLTFASSRKRRLRSALSLSQVAHHDPSFPTTNIPLPPSRFRLGMFETIARFALVLAVYSLLLTVLRFASLHLVILLYRPMSVTWQIVVANAFCRCAKDCTNLLAGKGKKKGMHIFPLKL